MAFTKTYVWEYRNGILYEELVAFPEGLIFYDNGVVHENGSHNQASRTSESFWPYVLHTYDPEADIYNDAGDAKAWDANDYYADDFPTDIDQAKDGIVYYLHRAGENGTTTMNTGISLKSRRWTAQNTRPGGTPLCGTASLWRSPGCP